jgi:hypothetical protein
MGHKLWRRAVPSRTPCLCPIKSSSHVQSLAQALALDALKLDIRARKIDALDKRFRSQCGSLPVKRPTVREP